MYKASIFVQKSCQQAKVQKKKQLLSYAPVFLLKMPYLRGVFGAIPQQKGGGKIALSKKII
ncbi:hypothetical protein, partial [Leyella stercorea]|uniref:hypothetical protein n=1 Tax=Leyella stercorea TaxID=363265 RepID=UPI003FEDB308